MSMGYAPYVPHDYSQDYFTMVITTGGTVSWASISNISNKLSYSTDNGTTWNTESSSITLSVNEGDKILWKGITTPGTSYLGKGIGTFSGNTNVRYSVEGNVMSLLYGDDFKRQTSLSSKNCALSKLFENNTNIISAENLSLPATTLTINCYEEMFKGCTNLTTAPELPATILKGSCYSYMFYGCTNLTTAPELPATTLAKQCYYQMFQGCTSLTTAPELPATSVADGCYYQMFKNCTGLTTTPELPAKTLGKQCYYQMFYGCTSLNSIKCLATYIVSDCTTDWVNGVAASGTFTKAASMASWTTGNNGIPSGWTVQDAA